MPYAPELLVLGLLHTLDPAQPLARAALVRDGRFACVGSVEACTARAGPGARRLEVGSAVPGLVDAHGHVMGLGRAALEVSCAGLESDDACVARAAERARALPAGSWIRGRGWDQNRWAGQAFPTEAKLSRAVPAHPVFLARIDGHAGWANAAALAAAGVGPDTQDPTGGKIVRDARGRPTGVLVDAAMDLVLKRIPPPSALEIEEALRRGMDALVRLGITAAHDAGVTPEVLEVYRRLAAEDRLPLRVYAMLEGEGSVGDLEARMAPWKATPEVGRLTVRAVKLYADGALGSRGAALHEDYADDRGNRGLFLTAPALLREKVRAVVRAEFQPAVHAIGDRAISETIAAIEAAGERGAVRALRPRIEHLQILRLADAPRLAAAGIVASMQPSHATSDAPWVPDRLDASAPRLAGAYAWRSVLRAGVPLAFGSDFPIESPDVRLGLAAAETRLAAGAPAPFLPDERLAREEALRAFTAGAAFAAFAEGRRGMIREGFDADLTAFAADVLSVPASALPALPVTHAIVGGRLEREP
ncbi:amidohydrolase [Anaeromyxobacter sp. Fw109-5]|uniref:amidohydrolase n=1 Tax=Anaeromyxobacter sp. (strain Fw109-5) TaxID=404589 RepID=UPI0000ED829D|nr:amidohydrolase [Anaeromyxobacter sp. Fw109-5]ABS26220.1 Amidohydrolase 3 [Anaeromyxobacter sp. Fw109-5]